MSSGPTRAACAAGRRRRRDEHRLEHGLGRRRELDARRQIERGGTLGEHARTADWPALAARGERAASLLENDDGLFVRELEGCVRASVEAQAPGAELARSRLSALLQQLHAERARAPEKCIGQHKCLVR